MRGNIIEELYYGNIDPQDHSCCPKSLSIPREIEHLDRTN